MWSFDSKETAKNVIRTALERVLSQPHMSKLSLPLGDIATDLEAELDNFCEYCGKDFSDPGTTWPCYCQRYD